MQLYKFNLVAYDKTMCTAFLKEKNLLPAVMRKKFHVVKAFAKKKYSLLSILY